MTCWPLRQSSCSTRGAWGQPQPCLRVDCHKVSGGLELWLLLVSPWLISDLRASFKLEVGRALTLVYAVGRPSWCSSGSLLTKLQKWGRFVNKSLPTENWRAPTCLDWPVTPGRASAEVGGRQAAPVDFCQMSSVWPLWVGNRPPSPDLLATPSFSVDPRRPGLHNSSPPQWEASLGSEQDSGFCFVSGCLRLEFDTKSANISLQRHILSPFPEPPRKPSLVACQTGSPPYVWCSVSAVGCHAPIEPYIQSSGCKRKVSVVGRNQKRKRGQQSGRQWALG